MLGKVIRMSWVGQLEDPFYFDFSRSPSDDVTVAAHRLQSTVIDHRIAGGDGFAPAQPASGSLFSTAAVLAADNFVFDHGALAAIAVESAPSASIAGISGASMDHSAMPGVAAFDPGVLVAQVFENPPDGGSWHIAGRHGQEGLDVPASVGAHDSPDFGSRFDLDQLVPTYYAGEIFP